MYAGEMIFILIAGSCCRGGHSGSERAMGHFPHPDRDAAGVYFHGSDDSLSVDGL
jgi:hypothetical protein